MAKPMSGARRVVVIVSFVLAAAFAAFVALIVFAIVGLVTPDDAEAFAIDDSACEIVGDDAVIALRLSEGPEFWDAVGSADIELAPSGSNAVGWVAPGDVEAGALVPSDLVDVMETSTGHVPFEDGTLAIFRLTPGEARSTSSLHLYFVTGEPAYTQDIRLSVDVASTGCSVSVTS
ncbi:hypothetical protein BH11ACT3_BH11ACT3_14590 [soil metagenome]